MSFKVAILGMVLHLQIPAIAINWPHSSSGNQENEAQWMSHYGIQVFDLSADQICSLLHNPDPSKGKAMTST